MNDNQRKAMFARINSPYEKALRDVGYEINISPEEDIIEIRAPDTAVADTLMTRIKRAGWDVPLVVESPLTVYGKKNKSNVERLAKELI